MKQLDLSKYTRETIGSVLEYSINWKNVREAEIREACAKAIANGISRFYVNTPYFLPILTDALAGSDVVPGCFIGTSSGSFSGEMKKVEMEEGIALGAKVLVSAINTTAIAVDDWAGVEADIRTMREGAMGVELVAVLGGAYLTDEQIRKCCRLCARYGVDAVATSAVNGLFEGPSVDQVLLMADELKDTDVEIKASAIPFPYAQNAYTLLRAGASAVISWDVLDIRNDFDTMREIGIVPPYAEQ